MPLRSKLRGFYQRRVTSLLNRRPFLISPGQPLISFTFDDFPQSALWTGGSILNSFGLTGTYYASLGIMGQETASGKIFSADDLPTLLDQGHELGCHTYAHCDSWETETEAFEQSVVENRNALDRMLPKAEFKTFSYPISLPRPGTKAMLAEYFLACRAGGQKLNAGTVDLSQLSSYFLEQSGQNIAPVRELIERNCTAGGWLIFSTHDICETPTRFGCTAGFFKQVVESAVDSGARILPVAEALDQLGLPRYRTAAGAKRIEKEGRMVLSAGS